MYVIIKCGARLTIILCLFGLILKKVKELNKSRGFEVHWVGWGWLPRKKHFGASPKSVEIKYMLDYFFPFFLYLKSVTYDVAILCALILQYVYPNKVTLNE